MNQLSRREQNRLEKRTRILEAAIKVFADAGYSGASMDAIAAECGLTKPTLYQYFASKDALFKAMMKAPRDVMMLAFDNVQYSDLVDQLLRFAWAYADTVMRPEFLSLARLVIGEAHRFPDIGREYQASGPDRVLKGLMQFMESQRDEGRLRFDDPELAAQDFWGLILSAPRNRALHDPDVSFSREELARYIQNGLRVFLCAYSANLKQDLERFSTAIADKTLGIATV
ncbi:MAG: TetR/AcrR family transcriptional regulator [Pikeienuella sp.]